MRTLNFLLISLLLFILQPFEVYASTSSHSHEASIQRGLAHTKKELSDAAITTKVKAKLLADSATGGMDIIVSTASRVVTLTGKVKSEAERKLAEDIAARTHGVKAVNNQLEIE